MTTFYLFSYLSGAHTGKTIQANTRDEAEQIALDNNINIYDDYGMTTGKPGSIPFTQKQVYKITQ